MSKRRSSSGGSFRKRREFFRILSFEQVEDRRLLAAVLPYQNAANPYDVNADGSADGTDLYLLDAELKANGERSLANPNGPVQYFWDVDGNRELTWADLELDLRYQTGTLRGESPKGSGKNTDSGSGGEVSLMSVYTVTLNSPGNVYENGPFSMTGYVSPPPPPGTMFMPTVNWGQSPGNGGPPMQVMIDSSGNFQIPHIYFDDGASPGNGTPSDMETITLSASIMGSPVSAQTTATVINLAPVPNLVFTNLNTPLGGPTWQVAGAIQDAGALDSHTVTIDWGDGSEPTVISPVGTNQYFSREHPYPPTGQTFIVSVDVIDDDTGSAHWSDDAPLYLLDLDSDADNNGSIEEDDDPIEATWPGAYVTINTDDDNGNNTPDLDEAPVAGEDDLAPFLVKWQAAYRPEIDNYIGWHVRLIMDPPPDPMTGIGVAKVWSTADKTGQVGFENPSIGLVADWEVGLESIPDTLYLEARSGGPITLYLDLCNPQGTLADRDTIVFTAIEKRRTILLFGYWPVTDIGVADRHGMLWPWKTLQENYKDSGYNVIAFSPTFKSQLGTQSDTWEGNPYTAPYWGKGKGTLEVDYRDTSNDFWKLVDKWDPIAIMSFSRGNPDKSWELEGFATNWAQDTWVISQTYDLAGGGQDTDTWAKPYIGGSAQDPAPPSKGHAPATGDPPDPTRPAAFNVMEPKNPVDATRASNLPMEEIEAAIKALFPDPPGKIKPIRIDTTGGAGAFVSNFMAYHVAWYREWMDATNTDPNKKIHFSGHTHVGIFVDPGDATTAVTKQLDVLIEALPP